MKERLSEAAVAARVAKEFQDGWCVNLGIGIGSIAMNMVPPGIDIYWECENGILGYGPALTIDEWERLDFNMTDASGNYLTEKPGMVVFDFVTSLDMMRGGHLDATVLGALQVSGKGDLANWTFERVPWTVGTGGGFDLAVGPKSCFIAMLHTTKEGKPKIVNKCTFPLTAPQCVDMIFTDLAVIEVTGPKFHREGLLLKEIAPGWTAEEVQALTEPKLRVAPDLKEIAL
jgi:3-oxoacid CoA-transferase subunit B